MIPLRLWMQRSVSIFIEFINREINFLQPK